MLASPILSPPKGLNLPDIPNLSAPIGQIINNVGNFINPIKNAPGIGGGLGLFLLKELFFPSPANEGEDEFLQKYKPTNPVKVQEQVNAPYSGGGISGIYYAYRIIATLPNGVEEDYTSNFVFKGKCSATQAPYLELSFGSVNGYEYGRWVVPFLYEDGTKQATPYFQPYRDVKFIGFVKQEPGADVNPPPLQSEIYESSGANPLPPPAPPSDKYDLKVTILGAPNPAPPLRPAQQQGAAAPPQVQPITQGENYPDVGLSDPPVNLPTSDPAHNVPTIGAAPTTANNTYTRTYTRTGSDAWGSTPGIRTYTPGVSGTQSGTIGGINSGSQGRVGNDGTVTPLNPATPANPTIPDVPAPSSTDNLLTAIASTLALILNQTSKTKIKEATSEAVCEKAAPGQCLGNAINSPSWLDGVNAALGVGANATNANILAKVGEVQDKLNTMQSFAEKAWKSLHLDKALQVANTALLVHNAMMLSKSLGQSLGDVTSQIINALPIIDEKESPIDVNEIVGDLIDNAITALIGAEAYTNLQSNFNKANRILTAAQGVVWAIRGMKDAATEVGEVLGSWIAKIGNNMMTQGLLEDRSFKWMDENPQFRQHYGKFVDRIDNLEEATGQISSIVSNTTEFTEQLNEAVTNTTTLVQVVEEFDDTKETAETTAKTASASPAIANSDLNKAEEED